MMEQKMRKEFEQILGRWSFISDVHDIPRRLRRIKNWAAENGGLLDCEEEVVTFMRDVQATREAVRRKPDEQDEDVD